MFGKYLEKTERFIRKIRVPRCEIPFVVLFQERSGSSHLCSVLENHSQVVCRQEDFYEIRADMPEPDSTKIGRRNYQRKLTPFTGHPVSRPSKRRATAHFHDIFSYPEKKACGFKLKFPVQPILFPEVIHELKLFGSDLHVISLTRGNILKQSISRQNMVRMQNANLWELKTNLEVGFPFRVDIQSTVEYANQLLRQRTGFADLTEQFRALAPVLDLVYEDLLVDQSFAIRQVFAFLQVDPDATIYSFVKKATPDKLSETVSNLDELKEAVCGTDLEAFLD